MSNEVAEIDEDDKSSKAKKNSKPSLKKIPANHYSVDDMDFNEPEYLQERNREEIKSKNLNNLKELANSEKEKEENEDEDEEKSDEEELSNEEEDEELEDDEEEELEESEEDKASITNGKSAEEKWVEQFRSICAKMNKKAIDSKQFEKLVNGLIEKLDPSKDENNKQRLCLLTEHLVEYYQSIFKIKSTTNAIDFNLVKILTSSIYNLTSKYGNKSTKKEPSPYIEIFKKLLAKINSEFKNAKVTERKLPDLSLVIC